MRLSKWSFWRTLLAKMGCSLEPQPRRKPRSRVRLRVERFEERSLLSANFAISNPVVTEALSAVFDVTYTGGGSGMVMAGYNTRNGSATSPADFSSTGGMLQFMTPGTTQQVSVTTSTDMLVEGSENFYLDLFDPMTGASLGTGTCTLNDPAAPHIGVTSNGGAVPNGSGSVDYGTVVVGQTLSKTFNIVNTGAASLSVTSLSVSGGGFTASGFSPTTVAPGGSTSFNVVFSPQGGATFSATVSISSNDMQTPSYTFGVHGLGRQAPIAVNDTGYGVLHDHTLTVAASGILANDTDPQGYALTASVATGPAHGTLSLNSNGGFDYTPNAHWSGADSYTYLAYNGYLYSQPASVAIVVGDNAPTGYADGYIVRENTALDVPVTGSPYSGVLANDTDPDGDTPLQAVLVAGPAHGTLSLNANGSFTYTPNNGYTGPDSFQYKPWDGVTDETAGPKYGSVTAVSLDVRAPTGQADSYGIGHGQNLVVNAAASVLANDSLNALMGTLTATLLSNPSHAAQNAFTFNSDGTFTYRSDATWSGKDSFTYAATVGAAQSAPMTVEINVGDMAPVGWDDAYMAITNTTLTVPVTGTPFNGVLANDGDPDGDQVVVGKVLQVNQNGSLSPVPVNQPTRTAAGGSVTMKEDGSFTYEPLAGYSGGDWFQYIPWDSVTDQTTGPKYGAPVLVSLTVVKPTVDINVDSNNDSAVDLLDDPASDPTFEEQTPGLIVLKNINDDDGNGVSDLNDTQALEAADPDLEEADLSLMIPAGIDLGGFQILIQAPSWLRVWDTATKNQDFTGASFTLLPGQTSFSRTVYLEAIGTGSGSVTMTLQAPPEKGGRNVDQDFVQVAGADPTVRTVTYLAAIDANQAGILSQDNPDYFKGGYRFIPGAQGIDDRNPDGTYRSRNVVRVRATIDALAAKRAGMRIAFRSFDVDDPTRTDANGAADDDAATDGTDSIDPGDSDDLGQGGDNRGTLVGISTQFNNQSGGAPGASVQPDVAHPVGYEGQLRPIFTSLDTGNRHSGKWNEQEAVVVAPFALSGGGVALDEDGNAFAEVELATTFSPGDNFRVLAIALTAKKELQDLNAGFSSPNNHRDLPTVNAANGVNNPAFDGFLRGGGSAADQLSVWRKVNMETDRMVQPQGDWQNGKIVNVTQIGDGAYWNVQTDIGVLSSNEYEDGILRWDGHNYSIISNTRGLAGQAGGVGTVLSAGDVQPGQSGFPSTVRVTLSVDASVDQDYLANGTIWIFDPVAQDWNSYQVVSNTASVNDPNNPNMQKFNAIVVSNAAVPVGGGVRFMRGTAAATFTIQLMPGDIPPVVGDVVEVYSDDYTLPANPNPGGPLPSDQPLIRVDPSSQFVYDGMYQFLRPGTDRSTNRLADAYLEPDYNALSQFDSTLAPKTHFNSTDWSDLVDPQREGKDFESDLFWVTYVTSGYELNRLNDGDGGGAGAHERVTRGRTHHQDSAVVAVEAIWDSLGAPTQARFVEQLGKTTLHEIGHELGIGHRNDGENVMHPYTEVVSMAKFFFNSIDVSTMRMRTASPGSGTVDDDGEDNEDDIG